MFVADPADVGRIVIGGNEHTAGALYRLSDESGHSLRAFLEDSFLQLTSCRLTDGLTRLDALKSIGVRRLHMYEIGDPWFEHLPVRSHAGGAHGRQRHTMITMLAGDDLDLVRLAIRLPIKARGLEGALIGFCSTTREIDGV